MNSASSFYPLPSEDSTAPPVLFAFAVDNKEQRLAIHNEVLSRLSAVAALSDALTTTQVEACGARSHACFLEAIAILTRDAKGLMEASVRFDR